MYRLITAMACGLLAAAPNLAQAQAPMQNMPGMAMPAANPANPSAQKADPGQTMSGMDMSGMGAMSMPSSIDLNDPMSREASGTAWLPDSSPMYGKMFMQPNGGMLMLHGAIMPRYVNVGSMRGDRRFDAPNWFMGMYSHPLGDKGQLGLRAMLSLDPVTEGGYGYPLLYQTGESWHGKALHDRQHPHDLFDELSATYSRKIGSGNSAYLYLGYPGEPALGPPTFMHRLIAYDLADAPIGHHWQDATHITFGVATLGFNLGGKVKLEGSSFTGREPDENRYNFDRPRFDSQSIRLSFNPNADNALQVSHGFVKNAEGDGLNQHRTTASWIYNQPLGGDANFSSALVWGQNNLVDEGKTNSYLAEADLQRGSDTVFTRLENIQKSGHELSLPEAYHDRKFTLNQYTAGYVRDLTHGQGIDTGLGFAVTVSPKPSALDAVYGTGTPVSFQIFLRLRPSRLGGMNMGNEKTASPPATTADTSKDAALTVSATIAPNPPHAGRTSHLTLTLTDGAGKPVAGADVQAAVAMTSMDMGTTHPAFQDLGNGRYAADVSFSMAGPWRVTARVASPAGQKATKTLDYAVAP